MYTSLEGDPLWFTVGKGSDELIPTGAPRYLSSHNSTEEGISVYALWKHRSLLPVFTTPARVIPVLVGGADLMIPGGTLLAFATSSSTHSHHHYEA